MMGSCTRAPGALLGGIESSRKAPCK
uniref:Uncharacterized protein n=1 Tax=Arundo donax TaxID=35708 RepID=A0A0A9BVK1_ARUDO